MDIYELTQKLKSGEISYTHDETKQILINAKVIMPDGTYNPEMFSPELVEASRKAIKKGND